MAHRAEFREDEVDVITAVPRGLNVIKNFIRDESAIKNLIDLEEELMLQCVDVEDKKEHVRSKLPVRNQTPKKSPCGSPAAEGKDPHTDPCTDLCDRQKTSITLEELTPPRAIGTSNKNSVVPREEIIVGRAFPIKFRIRRHPANLKDSGLEKHLLCTPTENTNVVLLTNCSDVMVFPSQRVDEFIRVPVTIINGDAQITEYMLDENTLISIEDPKCPNKNIVQ